jgi:hypothetical protein
MTDDLLPFWDGLWLSQEGLVTHVICGATVGLYSSLGSYIGSVIATNCCELNNSYCCQGVSRGTFHSHPCGYAGSFSIDVAEAQTPDPVEH